MAKDSLIEWTDHTFNPWVGCTKVSSACDNCYAESWAKRSGQVQWGNHPRKRTSDAYWKQPLKWNNWALASGIRHRVFCASLADVFDNKADPQWRSDLFQMIEDTPYLDWQLLTKRPQNISGMLWPRWDDGLPPNVWLGTTVENQEEAERGIPLLMAVQARVKFLSIEPLLGPISLWHHDEWEGAIRGPGIIISGGVTAGSADSPPEGYDDSCPGIDWVIVGGESGPRARPPRIEWVRSLRDQVIGWDIPFFFKQWGEYAPDDPTANRTSMQRVGKKFAGAELDGREWREMPT